MSSSLAKDFKTFSLLKFALPSMVMMIFTSLYTIVDGVFISYFIGDTGLSAANIAYPAFSIIYAVSIMLATGGCAIVAGELGSGKKEQARQHFSFLVVSGLVFGFSALALGLLFLTPIARLMGAEGAILEPCRIYLGTLLLFSPACVLQMLFQTFFVAEGRPALGLAVTVSGGVANALLDYLLMGPAHMGIAGAALATGAGQAIPALAGLLYFSFNHNSLYFTRFRFEGKVLLDSCQNGSSEMVTNMSVAIVTYLFNIIMLKLAGEQGVAAISIILYGQFLFNALFMGYSMGVAPVISFNYGRKNYKRLLNIFRICVMFIALSSIGITILAVFTRPFVIGVFTPPKSDTYILASHGFLLFSINFMFAGINIFASSLFTALSDGKTSAMISFLRTFAFLAGCIILLPVFLKTDGVWLSVPLAEFLTFFISCHSLYGFYRTYTSSGCKNP